MAATDQGWDDTIVNEWDALQAELHSEQMVPAWAELGGHRRSSYVFRGMANSGWPLKTSLERLGSPPDDVEQPALRAFGRYAPPGTFDPGSEWERLAVAQHNGLPTRVLDWTVSPLVAVHFATAESEHGDSDGVIWCVNADMLRDHLLPEGMRRLLWEATRVTPDVYIISRVVGPAG